MVADRYYYELEFLNNGQVSSSASFQEEMILSKTEQKKRSAVGLFAADIVFKLPLNQVRFIIPNKELVSKQNRG